MNADRMVNMLMRQVMRLVSKRMGANQSPEERERTKKIQKTTRYVQQGARMARRMGRF